MNYKKTIAFCAGSYDPFTYGHLGIIQQVAPLFNEVIIGIGVNANKKNRRVDANIMKKAIEETLKEKNLTNVSVIIYDELTARIAKQLNVTHFVRGLRNTTDYHYEEQIADVNSAMSDGIPTVYFRAGKLSTISSSLIMDFIAHNEDVKKYLPKPVYDALVKDKIIKK